MVYPIVTRADPDIPGHRTSILAAPGASPSGMTQFHSIHPSWFATADPSTIAPPLVPWYRAVHAVPGVLFAAADAVSPGLPAPVA